MTHKNYLMESSIGYIEYLIITTIFGFAIAAIILWKKIANPYIDEQKKKSAWKVTIETNSEKTLEAINDMKEWMKHHDKECDDIKVTIHKLNSRLQIIEHDIKHIEKIVDK